MWSRCLPLPGASLPRCHELQLWGPQWLDHHGATAATLPILTQPPAMGRHLRQHSVCTCIPMKCHAIQPCDGLRVVTSLGGPLVYDATQRWQHECTPHAKDSSTSHARLPARGCPLLASSVEEHAVHGAGRRDAACPRLHRVYVGLQPLSCLLQLDPAGSSTTKRIPHYGPPTQGIFHDVGQLPYRAHRKSLA